MTFRYFRIAGGNDTALVWGAKASHGEEISGKLLQKVEQVGFVNDKPALSLDMMGGELCINALLALAFAVGGQGHISMLGDSLAFTAGPDGAQIRIPLSYKVAKNTVIFDGIGYSVAEDDRNITKSYLSSKCAKFGLPAFGLLVARGNSIKPYVYVKRTDSLVAETACGSGSVAASLITGSDEIIQPTGKAIKIDRQGDIFTISAKVSEIKEPS